MHADRTVRIRVYDNHGRSYDRYTAVFDGPYRLGDEPYVHVGMSANPRGGQGVCLLGESAGHPCDTSDGKPPPPVGGICHLGTRIGLDALPTACRQEVEAIAAALSRVM